MSRQLDDLSERFKPLAILLLARFTEAGIPVLIVETRRTMEQHQANLANGSSWIAHSKHLDGDAIDVVPYSVFTATGESKLNWDPNHPVWAAVGRIGERIGLRWGGRWTQRDMGHFEYHDTPKGTAA